jgi:WD40 repeat protein
MKSFVCLIVASFIMILSTNSYADTQVSNIQIGSEIESRSSVYPSGNFAVFLTKTIIEVRNIVENKKIANLTFEEFSAKVSEMNLNNVLPEGIKLTWREKSKIKKIMEMNPQFNFRHIALSANGEKVALTRRDGSVFLWEIKTNAIIPLIPKNVGGTKLSPSGKFIGVLNEKGESSFSVIDLEKNKEILSMPVNAGATGFIQFSLDEKNMYVGISNFLLGYQLATMKKTIKIKLPYTFTDRGRVKESVISDDGRFLVCAFNWWVLIELSPEGRTKKLNSDNHFFVKDGLIVKSTGSGFKKIDFDQMDKFMETSSQNSKDDQFFSVVNIPTPKGSVIEMGVETIVKSTFYSFRMENELGETVVNIIKTTF